MIKATRIWGGEDSQGVAFGLLDGGRGLVASLAASMAVVIFAMILAGQLENALQKKQAIQSVILFYTCMTMFASLIVWFIIPEESKDKLKNDTTKVGHSFAGDFSQVLKNRTVWLQGGIIVAAYCGYKSMDNYGIYAVQILGMNDVESAQLTAFGSYMRPVAAVMAGVIADRWSSNKMVMSLFAVCMAAFLSLMLLTPDSVALNIIIANILLTFIAVFALRGIYFSLLEESKLKANLTGTAVGLISLVGYTPDIFFHAVSGRILDANPGLVGFQDYFLMLAGISLLGIIFSYWLAREIKAAGRS